MISKLIKILFLCLCPVVSNATGENAELTIFSIELSAIRFHSFFNEEYVTNNYSIKTVIKSKESIERVQKIISNLKQVELDKANPITRGDNSYIVIHNNKSEVVMISDGCYLFDILQKKMFEITRSALKILVPYENHLNDRTCLLLKKLRQSEVKK
jgi:hypothetical protein